MTGNQPGEKPMATKTQNPTLDAATTLEEWWERLGENPDYPVSREAVERLLTEMDFEIPACGLEYLSKVGLIAWPGNDEWEAPDIVAAVGACRMLQWFRREPDSIWWNQLSPAQRLRAAMRTEHPERFEKAERLLKFHPKHLAIMLLNAPDRPTAEMTFAALEAALESRGIDW